MTPRVTLLLGKPPRSGTLLAEVADDLAGHGAVVTLRLPHQEPVEPDNLDGEGLIVHRGLNASLAPLLASAHERGVPLCNPWPADGLLRDRRAWREALVADGIPLPPGHTVEHWHQVLEMAGSEPVVAKALAGPGRGESVVTGRAASLPADAPFPGPYLVEPRLPAEEEDRKLYVAGGAVRGLLKPSTLEHPHVTSGRPFTPDAALAELALEASRVLGAHLLGVDVLRTPSGPIVVDVNGFPGFRGVDDAPALVSAHIREHLAAAG